MSADTLPRVGTGSPDATSLDFSLALQALSRRLPGVVSQDARSNAEYEGVGEINRPAHLRSRFNGREFVLPIRFHRRLILGTTSELTGTDESGIVSVRLTAEAPGSTLRFGISAAISDEALPSEILPFGLLIRCAQNGETIDLSFAGETMVGSVMSLPDDDIEEFASYVDMVERIDRLQRMTGTSFPMPSRLSGEELEELDVAERLLSGADVPWNWAKASITMTVDPRDRLETGSQDAEMAVEVGGEYLVEIAGQSILLGTISQSFTAGLLTVTPSVDSAGEFDVQLRPGKNQTAIARLTSRAHFNPYDRTDVERVHLSADALHAFDEGSASLAAQVRG